MIEFAENVTLAPFTSIGLGGPARFYFRATDIEQLKSAITEARAKELPIHILGGGSNTIFRDAGFAGLVIHIDLKGIEITQGNQDEHNQSVTVKAMAGENWDNLVAHCCQRGLSGMECLSGIPGQAGATPIQNVGAYGQECSQIIIQVQCLDLQSMELHTFSNKQCGFAYRQSRFKNADRGRYIVTRVQYVLSPRSLAPIVYPELQKKIQSNPGFQKSTDLKSRVQAIRKAVLKIRSGKSMLLDDSDPHSRSCGSFFMNPVISQEQYQTLKERLAQSNIVDCPSYDQTDGIKVPAAFLIEAAGFQKGYRHKGFGISPKHALALVHYATDSSTTELLELRDRIQQAVHSLSGIWLEPEPVLV